MSTKDRPTVPSDAEYLAALYERHVGVMYKTALECLDDDDAKDAVVHDALLRMYGKIAVLRALDERAVPAYIASVVRHVALERRRRQNTERRRFVPADLTELSELPSGHSLEDDYAEREAHGERLRRMWEALGELSDGDRDLLIGKYASGKSDAELARMLGIKPESIRKKLTRAKQRARRIILRKEAGEE